MKRCERLLLVQKKVWTVFCAASIGNGDSSTEDSQIETYSVSFYDGEELLATQHVADGDCAEVSVAPEKNGYIFKGWYDAEGLFDFTTPITSNVMLIGDQVIKQGDVFIMEEN